MPHQHLLRRKKCRLPDFPEVLVNKFSSHLFVTLFAISLAVSARAASDIVVIDFGEPAYTVYAGLPAERAADVKTKISNQPAQLVSFSEFSEGRSKFISGKIITDDYPGMRVEEGIVELVRKYPGTPFGLTWNGGIAFTRTDYQYAKAQFAIYSKDAEEHRRSRGTNASADPNNPMSHLRSLLGW